MGPPRASEEAAMIHYLVGDATKPQGIGRKLIAHVCNDVGAWGAGFVVPLGKAYPQAEMNYRVHHASQGLRLGEVVWAWCPTPNGTLPSGGVLVANMVAQVGLVSHDNPVPLKYGFLSACLVKVAKASEEIGASIHMPRIGCGLAGGKWMMVETIIQEELVSRNHAVFVYDLPGVKT